MSVWLCIPSARPASEIAERLGKWRAMGYKIALWRNGPHATTDGSDIKDLVDWSMYTPDYRGWAFSCNFVMKMIFGANDDCDWCVCGGDDTDPDPNQFAHEIAEQCSGWFHGTFGVMQPSGDRFGADEPWAKMTHPNEPAYIDRICGSPWIGREAARRLNGGNGPLWGECYHMFSDQILKEHAERLGILWQRRDLTHHHEHPRRDGVARTPDFAAATGIYESAEWSRSKAIYERLKANDFAECMPIA